MVIFWLDYEVSKRVRAYMKDVFKPSYIHTIFHRDMRDHKNDKILPHNTHVFMVLGFNIII